MKINVNKVARKVEVDNRIPLFYYYRIADNLLRQASIYREEKNVVDLYIILLRFSSLVSETIPFHRDYQALHPKERVSFRKRLLSVLDELEFLKPEFQCRVDELNEEYKKPGAGELDGQNSSLYSVHGPSSPSAFLDRPSQSGKSYSGNNDKMSASVTPDSLWKYNSSSTQGFLSNYSQIDQQFNNISISLPHPKQETLSRHSFLGPSGLSPQWRGPSAEIKVQYPSSTSLISAEDSSLNQARQNGVVTVKDSGSGGVGSTMNSVLSLDDGRWSREDILSTEVREDLFQFVGVHQPSPPPVLARIQQEIAAIPPSKVADPRPGPAKPFQDGIQSSTAYQHLHVPVNLMEEFLRLARANTQRNLETCAVLAGSLKNRVFHITTLIVPKQESTSDSCSTLDEEEIFEVQDKLSLFPLGWIHTHPTQTCFMSSVDLHTHYSYQIMLPEAVAIVMAPTDASSPHGIFHLSDPGGVSIIRNCHQRGFHPHEEPLDGSPIYEHCSHVYMNAKLKFNVVDLREL